MIDISFPYQVSCLNNYINVKRI